MLFEKDKPFLANELYYTALIKKTKWVQQESSKKKKICVNAFDIYRFIGVKYHIRYAPIKPSLFFIQLSIHEILDIDTRITILGSIGQK